MPQTGAPAQAGGSSLQEDVIIAFAWTCSLALAVRFQSDHTSVGKSSGEGPMSFSFEFIGLRYPIAEGG
jgi:hypothetical protein